MKKMYSNSHEDYLAHVAIKKSLLKEYHNSQNDRIVYLNNGDEFQISIFNPYNYVIGVSFSFNSNNVNNSNKLLVLKPGERIWLDRYLDESRKLLFSTYEVDDCKEAKKAIEKNGLLTINFYKEKEYNNQYIYSSTYTQPKPIEITWTGDSPNWYYDNSITCYNTNLVNSCTTSLDATSANSSSWASTSIDSSLGKYEYSDSNGNHIVDYLNTSCCKEKSIETGRIEKGNHSNQQFSNYYGDFNSWSFKQETIKLLPISQKQVNSNDLNKKYCQECGRKIKDKFKYCPYCGAKQD